VFAEENRELAVRCGALHTLVDAGEVQLEAMRTRPSAAVVSANHFIVASLALLLTHTVRVHFSEREPASRLTADACMSVSQLSNSVLGSG
jgi:hypothetical protein